MRITTSTFVGQSTPVTLHSIHDGACGVLNCVVFWALAGGTLVASVTASGNLKTCFPKRDFENLNWFRASYKIDTWRLQLELVFQAALRLHHPESFTAAPATDVARASFDQHTHPQQCAHTTLQLALPTHSRAHHSVVVTVPR